MAITRLKNIYTSTSGRILYVSPDDFDASDLISNRGNSPLRPFKTLQRALLEAARFSYVPGNGGNNDRFDQFTIMLMPGDHIVDNRPGTLNVGGVSVLSDNSIFDLQNPNNDLYKFNSTRGGVIVPRGTSIVGLDLRKTRIIPKFVPDPTATDGGTIKSNYPNTGNLNSGSYIIEDDTRSAIFRVTGGCYFWQFTFIDGDSNGVYTGSPTPTGVPGTLVPFTFSHHKLTNFEYACFYDLSLFYQKASKGFSQVGIPTTDPLGQRVEENRIVGPGGIQADTTRLSSIVYNSTVATATTVKASDGITRVAHGFSVGNQIRIFNSDDAVSGVTYNGSYTIVAVSSSLSDDIFDQFSYILSGVPNANAQKISTAPYLACELETDTVDSASPYIFNISIRSSYGLCGMHANGAMASGFKSMVVAQYTGISLQKDDRSFVRICGGSGNTGPLYQPNYQDGIVLTCGSNVLKPAHQDINSQYKKGWRNYHIKASNDGYIQVVSVFAVGFADQFLVESGGDMSIANSESNFGSTALRAKGYKLNAFTKDINGYVSHIIPPANVGSTIQSFNWLSIDAQLTRNYVNGNRLYIYGAGNSTNPPSTKVLGYTVGGQVNDILYLGIGNNIVNATITPSGPTTKTIGAGNTGNPIQWDSGVNNWYVSVLSGSSIVNTLKQAEYSSLVFTSNTYFTRVSDNRIPNDKIYRLRYVIDKTNSFASPPQSGFVLQPLGATYTNVYYVYSVETYQPFITGLQDGIYYLTILLGNISPSTSNFNDNNYSQNVNNLYPVGDVDNPASDAYPTKSIADNVDIGYVYSTDGTTSVLDRSITKEAIIKWAKETNNSFAIVDNSNNYNYWDLSYSISINSSQLTSGNGNPENRLINIPNINVELRRPSIIRAGNQTFEYTGFGPGNYSTGFPSRQTIVLTQDQVKLSQSKRENGGIVVYSGLNANGDFFVGNTVLNAVTGESYSTNNLTSGQTNSPIFDNVSVTKSITVFGGTDNSITSNFLGPLSISGKLTLNNNLEILPTWNSSNTLQTAVKVNVTDNASNSSSKLLDLQISGVSKFNVDKSGNINVNSTGYLSVPVGNVSQRPISPYTGMFRFNQENTWFEGYDGTRWTPLNNSNRTLAISFILQ